MLKTSLFSSISLVLETSECLTRRSYLSSLFCLTGIGSWCSMAKLMGNRTDNDVKNRYHVIMRREKRAREGPDPRYAPITIVSKTTSKESSDSVKAASCEHLTSGLTPPGLSIANANSIKKPKALHPGGPLLFPTMNTTPFSIDANMDYSLAVFDEMSMAAGLEGPKVIDHTASFEKSTFFDPPASASLNSTSTNSSLSILSFNSSLPNFHSEMNEMSTTIFRRSISSQPRHAALFSPLVLDANAGLATPISVDKANNFASI